jgi:excisionase family DNA binding protein
MNEQEGTVDYQALSVSRLAKRLCVCERTARRIIEAGDLKAHRIGRQWRVFELDLRDYLARQVNRQTCRHRGAGGDAA